MRSPLRVRRFNRSWLRESTMCVYSLVYTRVCYVIPFNLPTLPATLFDPLAPCAQTSLFVRVFRPNSMRLRGSGDVERGGRGLSKGAVARAFILITVPSSLLSCFGVELRRRPKKVIWATLTQTKQPFASPLNRFASRFALLAKREARGASRAAANGATSTPCRL